MHEDLSLGALTKELRALEVETFEVVDHAEADELLIVPLCSTTSSTTSTTSCSA